MLQKRTPEEIEWLRMLTGDRIDWLGEPGQRGNPSDAGDEERLAVHTSKAG